MTVLVRMRMRMQVKVKLVVLRLFVRAARRSWVRGWPRWRFLWQGLRGPGLCFAVLRPPQWVPLPVRRRLVQAQAVAVALRQHLGPSAPRGLDRPDR